jgi:hypothetical protein
VRKSAWEPVFKRTGLPTPRLESVIAVGLAANDAIHLVTDLVATLSLLQRVPAEVGGRRHAGWAGGSRGLGDH